MCIKYLDNIRFDFYPGFADVSNYVRDKLLLPISAGTMSVGTVIDSINSSVQSMIDQQMEK
jgi:hypothetical protein